MIKIIARSILVIIIASGSLIACGGSGDGGDGGDGGDVTPTWLAEKIAQTIEKNSYTTVECAEIDMDPPGYLKGNKESGVCGDFIIVTYDPEVNTEWQSDSNDFVNSQGGLACNLGSADFILVATGIPFKIYADVALGNTAENILFQEFEKIAKDAGALNALYVDCSAGGSQSGNILFEN